MKILYAVQGTGNGHLARAGDVIPALATHGEVDIFVSGAQADIALDFPVKFRSKGLSFYFGKNGGVDFMRTFKRNSTREIYSEVTSFPITQYDIIINDFEPITAWASQRREIPCVGLSHQCALLSPLTPRPKFFDPVGEWILQHYAPTKKWVGFHFDRFDQKIYTPVIRREIRDSPIVKKDHFTVYLPAYDDKKIIPILLKLKRVKWQIFSKHARTPYHVGPISVFPVHKEAFTASLTTSQGVLCGAGFETPAEALYLQKKLFVIPMKSQLEQHYNAAALKNMGIPTAKSLKKPKTIEKLQLWVDTEQRIDVSYPDTTAEAVAHAMTLGKT